MKCLYQFICTFDPTLSESPFFKEIYGPVIKEDKHIVWIENHGNNSSIFHNVGIGKGRAIFSSPFDVLNEKELTPSFISYPTDDNEVNHEYMLSFFFEDDVNIVFAARKCKEACMKEYKRALQEKIDELTSQLKYTDEILLSKMNKF